LGNGSLTWHEERQVAREKKNEMRLRILRERLDWMVENHQVKLQQRTFSFIQDMITRLQRGKGVSPNMRKWVDAIIEDGLEKVEVDGEKGKLLERITAALGMAHVSHNHNILGEFGSKLGRGWSLSEKQQSWLDKILAEAETGPWVPSSTQIQTMQDLMNLRDSRNSYWYQNNPGTARAMEEISVFLTASQPMRKFRFEKACKSFAGKLRELESPRFDVGDKAFFKKSPVIILTAPRTSGATRGICYDILHEGEAREVNNESLRKRRG